jgi:hypothetical protein
MAVFAWCTVFGHAISKFPFHIAEYVPNYWEHTEP